MNEVTLFTQMDKAALVAFMSSPEMAAAAKDVDNDVTIYASFPTISIKGKSWTLVQGDERTVMRKLHPDGTPSDEIVQSLEMVILRANDKARTYYAGEYVEGAQDAKPTCYSNDSVAPSDRSTEKQSPKCATCRWAVFGTAKKRDGTMGKGTACSQNARLAVAAPDALDKPHMLRVPPTSLKPMRDAIDIVKKRGIPYPVVVMRMSFVAEEASPLLKFTPIGVLNKEAMAKSIAMREDPTVRAICGLDDIAAPSDSPAAVAPAPAPSATPEFDAALAAQSADIPSPVSPAAPSPAKATTPAVVSAPTAPPVTAPVSAPAPATAKPAEVKVASGNLLGELGALLGGIDG